MSAFTLWKITELYIYDLCISCEYISINQFTLKNRIDLYNKKVAVLDPNTPWACSNAKERQNETERKLNG